MDASALEAKLNAEALKTTFYPRQPQQQQAEQSTDAPRARWLADYDRPGGHPPSQFPPPGIGGPSLKGTLQKFAPPPPAAPPPAASEPPLVQQTASAGQTDAELANRKKKGTKIRRD